MSFISCKLNFTYLQTLHLLYIFECYGLQTPPERAFLDFDRIPSISYTRKTTWKEHAGMLQSDSNNSKVLLL